MSKVPDIVGLKEFNAWMVGTFQPAVIEFNSACGKNPELVEDADTAAIMLVNECRRVVEESLETINAFIQQDRVERLDGVVDTYWTNAQLAHLFMTFHEKFGEELTDAIEHLAYDEQLFITLAKGLVVPAITVGQGTIISGKAIMVAAERVIANNRQKYTDDFEVAEDWAHHINEGEAVKCYDFKGKRFYCIKRLSDDYIVKPYTFKPVQLQGIG